MIKLLQDLKPHSDPRQFVFCSVDSETYQQLRVNPIGLFEETEGVSLILEKHRADEAHLAYEQVWALINLNVDSALTAVGFLAPIMTRLAKAELSVNPVSAFHRDHLFVLWEKRGRAMAILKEFDEAD